MEIHSSLNGREVTEINRPRFLRLHPQRSDNPPVAARDQHSRGLEPARNALLADRRPPSVIAEAPCLIRIDRESKLQDISNV
jgi:hypothetical protein